MTPTPTLLDALLALPTIEQQTSYLRDNALLTTEGVIAVLDGAERLAGVDPDQSDRLTQLAEQLVPTTAPAALPRVRYLQAQVQAIRGDLAAAERLIMEARAGYQQFGLQTEALRTTVGLMRVLGESGRYAAALTAGEQALTQIGANWTGETPAEAADQRSLAAMIFQNCGFCYDQTGRYEEALVAYTAAEMRYRALGMAEHLSHITVNRGLVLVALGQVQAALRDFETARALYRNGALTLFEAQTLVNIGEAHLLLSNFLPSLQAFTEAEQQLAAVGDSVERSVLLRHMGDAYLTLNLYSEAQDAYQRAERGLSQAGLRLHHALTLWGLGMTLAARGQRTEAQNALSEAAQLLRTLENLPLLSAVLLEQSRLYELLGDEAAARESAHEAVLRVADSNWSVQKAYAFLRAADLTLGDTARCEAFLTLAQEAVDALDLPHLRYRLQQRWGALRRRQGDTVAAQRHLETAIAAIESLRAPLIQERLRVSFMNDKLAAYEDLVQLYLDRGDPASIQAAFAVAEQARSRTLADLVAGVIQTRLDEAVDPAIAAQLQGLQAELNAVYNELLGGGDESVRMATVQTLKTHASALEQAINRLRLRTAVQPTQSMPNPTDLPEMTVQGALPTEVGMVVYTIIGDEIMAFVRIGEQLHPIRQLSTVTQVQPLLQRLSVQWARFRTAEPFVGRHLPQLEQSTRRLLQLLYTELAAPIFALLDTVAPLAPQVLRQLVIVPHGLLHQLPFHTLHDGTRYLVDYCALSYAPSAAVFALCQGRSRRAGLAVALGVADPQIPAAISEATQVAAQLQARYGAVQLLLDEAASLGAVTALAGRAGLLHLACHGFFRGDNPMFSALKLHDGWLMAADAAQLDLAGAFVALSACESGRSQVMAGNEILGLTYAFLSAGVASLLVSQWLVQDQTTATLMERCYAQFATTDDLATALRAAQVEIKEHYPHPYYWAPFVLIGQRTPRLR
jgi:CHAT domain-containing protein